MFWHWWLAAAIAILVALGVAIVLRPLRTSWRQARFEEARRDFHRQRERLEAKFVQLGMSAKRPTAPRWVDGEFEDDVTYARSRTSGELSAFVAVTLEMDISADRSLTAGEGTGHFRGGTAVFRFDHGHWHTDGRAIFNLSPTEAIRFYQRDLELVGQEVVENL